MTKTPNPVDRHVGIRVRSRRIHLGMSQERLGDALGITFQQVQKYEKGTNRIGASRLQLASKVLGVPINYFFEGAQANGADRADAAATDSEFGRARTNGRQMAGFEDRASDPYVASLTTTDDEAALLAAFNRVSDKKLRIRIIELVEAMASADRT